MKSRILVAAFFILAIFGNPTIAHKATISFAINNQQSESLGTVTVSTLGGDTYLDVPGNTNASTDIASAAASVTINGQQVSQDVNADVTLPSSKVVVVQWVSPSIIAVMDKEILQ